MVNDYPSSSLDAKFVSVSPEVEKGEGRETTGYVISRGNVRTNRAVVWVVHKQQRWQTVAQYQSYTLHVDTCDRRVTYYSPMLPVFSVCGVRYTASNAREEKKKCLSLG